MKLLEIKDLHVSVEEKEILKGVSLEINEGEIYTIMGPNGSGKSTLALALAGHPKYEITKGSIIYKGEDITKLVPFKKARKGIFLSFQYPSEISGVTLANFLRIAYNTRKGTPISVIEFSKMLSEKMELVGMDKSFMKRYLNEGFSGGEKKRAEILQMAMLEPNLAILDETDSGLDIDALKTVASSINKFANPKMGILIITHYQRLLNFIETDKVSVMINGKIAMEGNNTLAKKLEDKGYDWVKEQIGKTIN